MPVPVPAQSINMAVLTLADPRTLECLVCAQWGGGGHLFCALGRCVREGTTWSAAVYSEAVAALGKGVQLSLNFASLVKIPLN